MRKLIAALVIGAAAFQAAPVVANVAAAVVLDDGSEDAINVCRCGGGGRPGQLWRMSQNRNAYGTFR